MRLIKDYEVNVTASTPAEAIRKAVNGLHGPPIDVPESNDTFYPSSWIVKDKTGNEAEFDRTDLEEFD
jgi:hypothetical protein